MPRYKTDRKCVIGGAVRQAGEEFFVEQPITTRAKLNKNGKRTGKKASLPEWLTPVDQSAKDAAADKEAAKAEAEAKKQAEEEQQKELQAAGVGNKKTDFMQAEGEVEQV